MREGARDRIKGMVRARSSSGGDKTIRSERYDKEFGRGFA